MTELQFAIGQAVVHQTGSGAGRRGVVPAPVGGWNTQDPEAAMQPQYAVECENYFPERGRVVGRKGYVQHADTTDTAAIGTLYNHISGTINRLYAVSGSKVYDVTTPTSITELVASGVTESRWRGATINGHAVLVNGTDAPLRVDATGSVVAHGYSGTGLTVSDLTQVTVFKNRLFFLEKDSQKLWYGGLNAVTGTLSDFNLGYVAEEGGNCVGIGTITRDTGVGVDDLLCIFMQRGHVLVYAGTDPTSAATWQLSGIFLLGRLVGDKPLVKLGGDLIAVTADGYVPMLSLLASGREQRQLAISDKIGPSVTEDVETDGDNPGWQAILYPEANWLLFNVPKGGMFHQHVMNVQTGAWCLFTGMEAECWETWRGNIYFGGAAGKVNRANVGGSDGGSAIRGVVRSAYNYLGSPYDKQFRMLRAHLESGSTANVNVGASVDFARSIPQLQSGTLAQTGTQWDTAQWDTFQWGSGVARQRQWRGIAVKGSAISVHVASSNQGQPVTWFSSDVLYDGTTGAITAGN